MIAMEAIEPGIFAPGLSPRWIKLLDVLLRMLHALTISEGPYAYHVATERPRA